MDSTEIAGAAADTTDPRVGLRAVSTLRALTDTLELRQVEAGPVSYTHLTLPTKA